MKPSPLSNKNACFNPRSRKGNDGISPPRPSGVRGFNPRSRKGNDENAEIEEIPLNWFQSTFPQGERPDRYTCSDPYRPCFNPRSRKGNDTIGRQSLLRFGVSIHVPARGTTLSSASAALHNKFQSTFPQGERLISPPSYNFSKKVSIHVPARGTTEFVITFKFCPYSFNPRSRKGNDDDLTKRLELEWVSIHVPARGTTAYADDPVKKTKVSIHVPARGTTRLERIITVTSVVSIHVPARGTTSIWEVKTMTLNVSIHVPARGTTQAA